MEQVSMHVVIELRERMLWAIVLDDYTDGPELASLNLSAAHTSDECVRMLAYMVKLTNNGDLDGIKKLISREPW